MAAGAAYEDEGRGLFCCHPRELLSRRTDLHARVYAFANGLLCENTVEELAAALAARSCGTRVPA